MKTYELLKQNAPKVFKTFAVKRVQDIKLKLDELRSRYKNNQDEDKKEVIKNEGIELKEELETLKQLLSLDND